MRSFMVCIAKCYKGEEMWEDEVGGECGTYERQKDA
jgi:hypothetical protein